MDFLRRLNPARAALPSAARPVLAPRFAPRHAPAEDMPVDADAAFVAPLRQSEAKLPREAERAPAPLRRSVTPAAVEPRAPSIAILEPAPRDAAVPVHRPAHAGRAEAERVLPIRPSPRIEPAVAPVRAEAPMPPMRTPPAPAHATPIARAAAARPSRERAPASPLSPAAIAARLPPPAPTRTVVHVTIDRIDVRAPAAPASPPTPQRKVLQPSVSLADYLRPNRGGVS